MKCRYRALSFASASAILVMLSGCSDTAGTAEPSGAATQENFGPLLSNASEDVIIATYAMLHERANTLFDCTRKLDLNPSDEVLEECQSAWVSARVPWEQSEGFLFGPVADEGLDPAMDSWPVDHQQLNALMASHVELTADSITSNLGGGMKGFHTIEFLLWGKDQTRTAANLKDAPRERSYLVALAEALGRDTQTLLSAWKGDDAAEGYGARFKMSGKKGGLYSTQLNAVQELLGGMIGICDEVAFGKIAEPYKARDPNLIESQFSYNSLLDFSDNMWSIRNVYQGSLDGSVSEASLSAMVARYDAKLDAQVRKQVRVAAESILAIGENGRTFRDAIVDPSRDADIERAQDEIVTLMDLLSGQVLPLFAR